jgi:hypothetical protein
VTADLWAVPTINGRLVSVRPSGGGRFVRMAVQSRSERIDCTMTTAAALALAHQILAAAGEPTKEDQ